MLKKLLLKGIVLFSALALPLQSATKFLIVANAPNPIDWVYVDRMKDNGYKIISLDGATNQFLKNERKPHVVLGDLDSVEDAREWGIKATFSTMDNDSLPYTGVGGVLIVPAKDQDCTDLHKAIIYCDSVGATQIIIINAHGGRMDHELINISLLKRLYRHDRSIRMRTEQQTLEFVHGNEDEPAVINISGKIGDYIGVVGFPKATLVKSTGVQYSATHYPLELLCGSTCNPLVAEAAQLIITGDALVISPNNK